MRLLLRRLRDDDPRSHKQKEFQHASALLYLLEIFVRNHTVSPTDAVDMIMLTPTRRLEWLREQRDISVAHEAIDQLLKRYEEFLKRTDESEEQLVQRSRIKVRAATS